MCDSLTVCWQISLTLFERKKGHERFIGNSYRLQNMTRDVDIVRIVK